MKMVVVEISVLFNSERKDAAREFVTEIAEQTLLIEHQLGEGGGVAMIRLGDPEDVEVTFDEEGAIEIPEGAVFH